MFRTMAIMIFAVCLSAYAAAEDKSQPAGSSLVGHKYVLTQVNGKPVKTEREVFVQFGAERAITGAVCNRFNGIYAKKGCIISVENLISTRMACPGEMGALENGLFQALRAGVSVAGFGDALELRRDDTVWLFRKAAEKAKPEAPKTKPEVKPEAKPETKSEVKPEPKKDIAPKEAPVEAKQPEAAKDKAENADAPSITWKDLEGRKFTLARVDGEEFTVDSERQPFVEFGKDGRLFGSACNSFNGPAELKDGTLTVKNAAATMKMCIDQKLAKFEGDFHKLLREGAAISLDGKALILSGSGRTFVYQE